MIGVYEEMLIQEPGARIDVGMDERKDSVSKQTISFIKISIEAGILLGGKHEACFVLGMAGIEPMPS
jgi:hypothetical protein